MVERKGIDFITRSDIENDAAKINNDYLQQNEGIVIKALKDNATEEDDENLTEYLKKIETNIFRYKFREEDKNGDIREYRFSFEEDKVVVNIRNSDGKIIQQEEFKYEDYFRIFFNDIISSLTCDDEESVFFRKNRYNSSIANTALKYYFENIFANSFEDFVSYFNKQSFPSKISGALIRTSLEIGDIELYKFCLSKSYETEENLIKVLHNVAINALIGDNTEMITSFDSEFKKYNISYSLSIACTNKKMDTNLVQYLFENCENHCSIDDMIELFEYIYDPRIAKLIFNKLSSVGCNIYDINNNGYCHNILCSIAKSGSIEVMQYMLDEISKILTNEEINDIINKDRIGETILADAVMCNNIDMIRFLLLRPGININVTDKYGETPLHKAVFVKNIEIIKFLLANDKIDVNIADKYGETPLHKAVFMENVEIIKLLLTNDKIDVNKKCVDGYSPLVYAIIKHENEIIKCLLEGKAYYINKNIKNIKDKQKEISKQIEILEDMKNKYTDHKIFIEGAIEEFKVYSNYDEIKKSKCNIF